MSSARLGRVVAEALVRAGVHEVVVCPGSRSTAVVAGLAAAAASGRVRLHTRSDERVAGFLALGLARATSIAAVVVTSGTALGNLMPAVMEARLSGVPLVVVTADRPATLIGSGSNQTTEQIGLFGRHVVDDIILASTDDAPQAWFAGLARTIAAARGLRTRTPGPVHVNAAFTEPFLPDVGASAAVEVPPPVIVAPARPAEPTRLAAGPRTVVLAGDATPAVGQRARAVAEAAELPLLAEPSSNARGGPNAVAGYRELLDSGLGRRIERVLVFGHPTLSRPVSRLLARADLEIVSVGVSAVWADPGWQVDRVVDDITLPASDPQWLAEWREADRARIAAQRPSDLLTGTRLAAAVVASAQGNLVFGASNPIRDADLAPIAEEPAVCWANRGLSGIDGVISTAQGIALGSDEPTTVLLGDLGFLHDVGALHLPVGQPVPKLRVVVADDGGGTIFAALEAAERGYDWFEALFTMPHGRDLVAIASGFGWPARRLGTSAEVEQALALPCSGIEVLVVSVTR